MEDVRPIGIIGLGYVGLPLALAFARKRNTVAFDSNSKRVEELSVGVDITGEVSREELWAAKKLRFSNCVSDLKDCHIFIVAVPTPLDEYKRPDLENLLQASKEVGNVMSHGDIVIYESTVYPGCTEEQCVPVLEQISGLKYNEEFFVGYSPERINPGDKSRGINNIVKVTSGSNKKTAEIVDRLYNEVIDAGTYSAESIKIAEAAKVIENVQRDVNIALVNELATVFHKLGIDTASVMQAAATKWNFMNFSPGLVGGHCIGVDPYYLAHKAMDVGAHPKLIFASREINERMIDFVANRIIEKLNEKNKFRLGMPVNVLGVTFKENCTDTRNSGVVKLIRALEVRGCKIFAHDPLASLDTTNQNMEVQLFEWEQLPETDAMILASPHNFLLDYGLDSLLQKLKKEGLLADLKAVLEKKAIEDKGFSVLRI